MPMDCGSIDRPFCLTVSVKLIRFSVDRWIGDRRSSQATGVGFESSAAFVLEVECFVND